MSQLNVALHVVFVNVAAFLLSTLISILTFTGKEDGSAHRSSLKNRPGDDEQAFAKDKSKSRTEESAIDLLNFFSQRNLDAVQRCIRNTLESIRKRITASMMAQYGKCMHCSERYAVTFVCMLDI